MSLFGRDRRSTEEQAGALMDQGLRLYSAGRVHEALAALEQALALGRELGAGQPDDPHFQQATASLLYLLGAVYLAADRPAESVDALDESERLYRRLDGQSGPDTGALVADVQIRRAATRAAQGRGASAMSEAATAVTTYIDLTDGDPDHRPAPD